jgi:hypothetical protein
MPSMRVRRVVVDESVRIMSGGTTGESLRTVNRHLRSSADRVGQSVFGAAQRGREDCEVAPRLDPPASPARIPAQRSPTPQWLSTPPRSRQRNLRPKQTRGPLNLLSVRAELLAVQAQEAPLQPTAGRCAVRKTWGSTARPAASR